MTAAQRWQNWAGRVRCAPAMIATVSSEDDAVRLLASGPPRPVRMVGSGHSFTPLAETSGTLVRLAPTAQLFHVDREKGLATIWAGTPLWALGPLLHPHGLALANQGDIDRQTIAGAVSTGTHGTGVTLGSMSTMVAGVTLVTAAGDVVACNAGENPELFEAARLSLGSLGIVTRLTLRCIPSYRLVEKSWLENADQAIARIPEYAGAHRHYEFFWFPYANRVIAKSLDETLADAPPPRSAEQMRARGEKRPADEAIFRLGCTLTKYVPPLGPSLHGIFTAGFKSRSRTRWSFEAFPSPRNVRFNEMEYAMPVERGAACLEAVVRMIRDRRIRTAFPIEMRLVKQDDIWISPFAGRDAMTLSVHQYAKDDERRLFRACEEIFLAHDGRPHWGKQHALKAPDFRRIYPAWQKFCDLRAKLDPDGRFLNAHLSDIFGVSRS